MTKRVLILVGTKKGAFILDGDAARQSWQLRGPFCEAWPLNHVIANAETRTVYATGGNEWFGPAVWKSEDLGETWTHSSEGLKYAEGEEPIKCGWSLSPGKDCIYAGVEPAGLFRSEDGGVTWAHVEGLRNHPTRPNWTPGGGGLNLHTIIRHPGDGNQLWIGISAVGVFHTSDGCKTWTPRNVGIRNNYMPEGQQFPEVGHCVHSIAMAAGSPGRLYQQNHCGMYRSDDGGKSWSQIENGLPSTFGFPCASHPRDKDTFFLIPLNGDILGRYMPDAKAAVYCTRDGGETWEDLREGLPQEQAFFGVLRQAMATDKLDPAGIYFGSSSGSVFASADEGGNWKEVARHLPTITSVETLVVE
ncbi:MAG: glycoside hydrolase [Alphaproteobacteria bacterium BRH_c36]|nr:MAG: glycoside hydrolase [Alphaproteobacteria bacterium BRH_c36]